MLNAPPIEPGRTAMLVMDYQVGVLDILDEPDELLGHVARAISLARHHGIHIAYVRVGFDESDFDAIPERSMMAAMLAPSGRALRSDAPLTAIAERLRPEPGDTVVRKTRVGIFSTTDLDERLHCRGIDTLILCGISTGNVVLAAVVEAFDLDYLTYVLNDACGEPEVDVHDFLMTKIFPRKSHVITVPEFDSLLQEIPKDES